MNEQLLKLIFDYSINGKKADINFVKDIVNIYMQYKPVDNFCRAIYEGDLSKLSSSKDDCFISVYLPALKLIQVDFSTCSRINQRYEKYMDLFNDLEKKMFINTFIAQSILHELEHADELRISSDHSDNSIDATIYRICFSQFLFMKNGKVISDNTHLSDDVNYWINPIERVADINAYKTICKSLELIKKHVPNLYEFYLSLTMQCMVTGYDQSLVKGNCPTKSYLENVGLKDVWSNLCFYHRTKNKLIEDVCSRYSPTKRFSLGLPVTLEEYEEHSKLYLLSNKNRFDECSN